MILHGASSNRLQMDIVNVVYPLSTTDPSLVSRLDTFNPVRQVISNEIVCHFGTLY